MNYQPTSLGVVYLRMHYPRNMLTPWGKPNWLYIPILGGTPINNVGGYGGPPYGGPTFGGPPFGGPPFRGPPFGG